MQHFWTDSVLRYSERNMVCRINSSKSIRWSFFVFQNVYNRNRSEREDRSDTDFCQRLEETPRICELLRQFLHFPLLSFPRPCDLRDLSDSPAISSHPEAVARIRRLLAARWAR